MSYINYKIMRESCRNLLHTCLKKQEQPEVPAEDQRKYSEYSNKEILVESDFY